MSDLPGDAFDEQAMQEFLSKLKKEKDILEDAPWFGKTGLPETIERELPRYLRLEFGESLLEDEEALRASELGYLGKFTEVEGEFHYWLVPISSDRDEDVIYAYIRAEDLLMGCCDREPPPSSSK